MGHAVNLVVSCSNRKRYETAPGLAVTSWLDLTSKTPADLEGTPKDCTGGESILPQDLYMGEHWSVVRDIPSDATDRGWDVRLWICSAGYGLIQPDTLIKSYQADVRRGNERLRCCRERDRPNGAAQDWWTGVCSYSFSGEQPLSSVFCGPGPRLSAHAADRRAFGRLSERS